MLPIDRTNKAALDTNLVNGLTSDAPKLKANNDTLYNSFDELFGYAAGLVQSNKLSAMGIINVKDYNASGSSQTTTGSITTGTKALVVASAIDFTVNQGISIAGAGAAGATLITSITAISGTTLTIAVNASATVSGAAILHDDSDGLQAAIDACPPGGSIHVFKHNITKKLIINKPITIRGDEFRNSNWSGSGDAKSYLKFSSSIPVCIESTNVNFNIKDLIITGNNQALGINVISGSISTDNLVLQSFVTGLKVTNGYYNKINDTFIGFCDKDITFDNCYNINAVGLSLRANITCIELLNGSTMRMIGGSIETFTSYGAYLTAGSKLDLFGTYFEGGAAGTGFGVNLGNNCGVVAIGTHIYLTAMAKFIYAAGATGINIYSRANKFIYPTTAFTVYVYAFDLNVVNNYVDIAGDNWEPTAGAGTNYIDATVFGNQLAQSGIYMIQFPANHPNFGKDVYTPNDIQAKTKVTPVSPSDGTIIFALNNGFGTDDPMGIHAGAWGYNPYRTVYEKGQWRKVGVRIPNQVDSVATDVATLKADFNSLLQKLRDSGVMI